MIITELQINDTVEQQLHLVASRQIPFAAAASLTAVAKIAQAEVRNQINETFRDFPDSYSGNHVFEQ